MNLTDMRQILAAEGIQLTKSLGQNFLHDGNQLRRIVAAADLGPTDSVLEIGPGLGPLTELLLPQVRAVLAIEKDRRLVELLEKRFHGLPTLTLRHDDALEYLRREPAEWSGWKLVSNLPYSVASPILVELALGPHGPACLVATLQLEVGQRLMAQAGDENYGLLALLVQLRYQPASIFKIPASCFFPAPEVDSACVKLVRRTHDWLSDAQGATYHRLVKRAFSQRRKMMFKLLKQDWPEAALRAAFATAHLTDQIRAEMVPLEKFVALTQALHP